MECLLSGYVIQMVALLAEGVDRNFLGVLTQQGAHVALLAEGVDRNSPSAQVAALPFCRPPRGGRG